MVIKIAFLLVLCVLPMIVVAIRPNKNPFLVEGRVYCDPCRVGFETSAATYISGAEVSIECKDRMRNNILYSKQVKTDSSGSYRIFVDEKLENQICDVKLVSSPQQDCNEATPDRDHSRVILNRNNGIATNERFVNNMGFMKHTVAPGCEQIIRNYRESDNNNRKKF